jgi:hypothetical protein
MRSPELRSINTQLYLVGALAGALTATGSGSLTLAYRTAESHWVATGLTTTVVGVTLTAACSAVLVARVTATLAEIRRTVAQSQRENERATQLLRELWDHAATAAGYTDGGDTGPHSLRRVK